MTKLKRTRRRRIAVVTGTRAEYGLMQSLMKAIRKHPRLSLQLVVTGIHLIRKFGYTVDEIVGDGWRVDARVRMQTGNDDPTDQAVGLGRGVAGISRFLQEAKTDIVVVLGDRIEATAGALAATTTGRLLAHIHGGDVARGDFDDPLRNAITKLAHVHFTATRASTRRVLRMGEDPGRVHCVGAPGLDRLYELVAETYPRKGTRIRSDQALVVHHACGRSSARERRTMRALLRAVGSLGLVPAIIYPNSDRGHVGILEAIDAHRRAGPINESATVRSLDRDAYLRRLMEVDVLVGNSSSGIIEAAVAGTPAVNVGPRQQGRERSGKCVIDADETFESIRSATRRALAMRPKTGATTAYGSGGAGALMADILAKVPLDDAFRLKPSMF